VLTLGGIWFWVVAIVATIIVLGALVLFHELGHFLTARLFGIRVLEFGIGFPPRAKVLGHDHETEYTLNYLPIGGFVLLEGEDKDSDDPRAFGNARLPKQVAVLCAGVFMNFVAAFLLFFVVAWLFAPGEAIKAPYVVPGGAAANAGLQNGVTIESLNGQRYGFMTSQHLLDAIKAHAGEKVTIGYIDTSGVHKSVEVTLGTDASKGILGITCAPPNAPASTNCGLEEVVTYTTASPGAAVVTAWDQTVTSLRLVLDGLGQIGSQLATNPSQAPAGVQGPVGITHVVGVVLTDYGPAILVLLAAVLSANLGLINILPFPPLDGGRIAILIVKRAFGMKGVSALETATYLVGFALLMAFVAWISFFDIIRAGSGG
jgi:regulator of sigma E protease